MFIAASGAGEHVSFNREQVMFGMANVASPQAELFQFQVQRKREKKLKETQRHGRNLGYNYRSKASSLCMPCGWTTHNLSLYLSLSFVSKLVPKAFELVQYEQSRVVSQREVGHSCGTRLL